MRSEIAREGRRLVAATQFLTRLPVPAIGYEPDWLPRSARYFPLVGIAVGLMAACMLAGAATLWPEPVPALLAVAAAILVTGALHEDGLADTADGFGGGTAERRLAIMKDSGLGAYGALALGLVLALRVAALAAMPLWLAAAALVAAHAGGRLMPVILMARLPYAGDPAKARVTHEAGRPGGLDLAVASATAFVSLLWLPPDRALTGLVLGLAASGLVVWRACRPLGGFTGDVLGAAVALFETGFLLGAASAFGPSR